MSQLLATGTRVVYDTTDDMTLDQAKQAARDELGGEVAELAEHMESSVTLLSNQIDLRVIKGELETYLRLIEAGVQIGKSNSPYNVLIDDDSVDIVQSGVTIATFAFNKLWTKAAEVDSYVKIGGATLEWSATTGFSLDV